MMILKVLYSSIVQPWSYESSAASECWVNADDTVRRMPNLLAMFWLRCVSWQTAAFGAPRRVSGDCQAWKGLDRIQLRDEALPKSCLFCALKVEASIPQQLATLQGKRPIQPTRRSEFTEFAEFSGLPFFGARSCRSRRFVTFSSPQECCSDVPEPLKRCKSFLGFAKLQG